MNALDGITVLDLSTGVAGANCTKLLADFGADVIAIEPPEGSPLRQVPPFAGDIPHPERSLLYLQMHINKRSVTLNLENALGSVLAARLAARCHVVVEDGEPGALSEHGLGYEELAAERPELVYASITPWGQTGPYAELGLRASEITLQAMGGPVNATGSWDREPLKLGGNLALIQAGVVAAFAVVATVLRVESGGAGDHIDVSVYETQMGSRDRRTSSLTAHAYEGVVSRRSQGGFALASGVRPCLDGYVNMSAVGAGKIQAFVRMIDRADLEDDPRLNMRPAELDPAFIEDIEASYLVWLMQRTKRAAVAEMQRNGLLAGAINTPADLVSDPHYRARGVWETIEHPAAGTFEYPGRPFLMSKTPRPQARRAPLLGEHTAEVLEGVGVAASDLPQLRAHGVI